MSIVPTRAFWIATHRYLGLATLLFLFVAAFTGCLLCVRGPLDAALNPDLFKRPTGAVTIDAATAVTGFETGHPDARVLSFPTFIASGRNLQVSVGPRAAEKPLGYDQAFLDGSDGHLVGVRSASPGWDRRRLMEGVYMLHYTLLAGTAGRWFMGLIAIGWLIGAIVGLYLTFPARGPYLRPWLRAWTIRTKSKLPRLLLDLHEASALWLLIGVFGMAATSVCLNFFDEMFAPAVSAISPAKPSPFDGPAPTTPSGARLIDFTRACDAAQARAAAHGLQWRAASLAYNPDLNLYGVGFTRSGVVNYSGLGPVTYYLDARDGHFVYQDNPYQDSGGRKATRILYPLHTGQIIGPIGIAFVFVFGLQTLELCVTGAYVWWVRRPPRIAHRKAKRDAAKVSA